MLFHCASIAAVDIFYAINSGKTKMVRQWVDAKENINQLNNEGQSALIAAVIQGKLNLVLEVSKANIDLNIVDNHGKTALDWAADYGNRGIIRHLILVGCKAAQQNSIDSIKAVFLSAYKKNRWIVGFGFMLVIPFIVMLSAPVAASLLWCSFGAYYIGINLISIGLTEIALYHAYKEYFYVRLALNNVEDSVVIKSA